MILRSHPVIFDSIILTHLFCAFEQGVRGRPLGIRKPDGGHALRTSSAGRRRHPACVLPRAGRNAGQQAVTCCGVPFLCGFYTGVRKFARPKALLAGSSAASGSRGTGCTLVETDVFKANEAQERASLTSRPLMKDTKLDCCNALKRGIIWIRSPPSF